MVTTNISESSNSWLLNEREYSWFSCLTAIVRKTQQRMFDLRTEYSKLTTRFAPWVEAKVMKFYSIARKRLISCVSDNVYEVMRESTRIHAIVDIAKKTCSCNFWKEHQYLVCMRVLLSCSGVKTPSTTFPTTTAQATFKRRSPRTLRPSISHSSSRMARCRRRS
jgi:hypothetical protein